MTRLLVALAAALWLASCGAPSPKPPEAQAAPALWEVSGPKGQQAWLFGTIHALPDKAEWFTAELDAVLDRTGVLVVEVGNLRNAQAGSRAFSAVSSSPGLPPLLQRLPPAKRASLAAALKRVDMAEADFATTETWAAALQLANAGGSNDSDNGVDRALLARGLPVVPLEGFTEQFAIFDRLAEPAQAVLLYEATLESAPDEERALTDAWLTGDLKALEREENEGFLTDPELRHALLTDRNQAWARRIAALIVRDRRPLVAVGAAHMVGPEGLPALLAARGFTVRRIQ